MPKLSLRPSFSKDLDALKRNARKQYMRASEILMELQRGVEPSFPIRSETRIDNCVKFELQDGYRMVFQRESNGDALIALTVGKHDHVDSFLDGHKGWIFDHSTGKVKELRLATIEDASVNVVATTDVESTNLTDGDEILSPLFQDFTPQMLASIGVPASAIDQLRAVTDANSLDCMLALNVIEEASKKAADLLLSFATGNQEMRAFIVRTAGDPDSVRDAVGLADIDSTENSDEFLTFSDPAELQNLLDKGTFQQWQLFLHPDQRALVEREFKGPSRIRGISGSGKTVVALHRARHLALKCEGEKQKVLFTTFDKGLANASSQLLDSLCGDEREAIEVTHLHRWCLDFMSFCDEPRPKFSPEVCKSVRSSVYAALQPSSKQSLSDVTLEYCWSEVDFLMGRFLHEDREEYLETDRAGRGKPLTIGQRQAILDLYTSYHKKLYETGNVDAAEFVRMAFRLAKSGRVPSSNYSAVIVDEVQDISELGLRLLHSLCESRPNGLMLVGDNTQRIYTRGYTLRGLGIDIAGRGIVLKKNYRNTRQILAAAFPLIADDWNYDLRLSGVDPETARPEFSVREGTRPYIVKCQDEDQEGRFLASEITGLLKYRHYSPAEICVLARNRHFRQMALTALRNAGINAHPFDGNLLDEAAFPADAVRVSSLHRAKGHEFAAVFIVGCIEGVIPPTPRSDPDSLSEEAAVLYVGLTRARDILYLSHAQYQQRGQRQSRSSFLDRIEANCDPCEFRR